MNTFNAKKHIENFIKNFLIDSINAINDIMTPEELERFVREEGRKMLGRMKDSAECCEEYAMTQEQAEKIGKALKDDIFLYDECFSSAFASIDEQALKEFYIAKALLRNDRQSVAEAAGLTDGRFPSDEDFNEALEGVICDRFFSMTGGEMEICR